MACWACQKRAQERLAKMKEQAEHIKKMQAAQSAMPPARKELIPPEVELTDANSDYFAAKMKLFWKL